VRNYPIQYFQCASIQANTSHVEPTATVSRAYIAHLSEIGSSQTPQIDSILFFYSLQSQKNSCSNYFDILYLLIMM
jgi:hypothetical protein